jgi:predicted metal-dependent hydrolase
MGTEEQLSLPMTRDSFQLRDHLQRLAGRPVSLFLTDNTSSMVSLRLEGRVAVVRLHRMFLDAGSDVLDEIAGFLRRGKGTIPKARHFLKQNGHRIRKAVPRKTAVRPEGKCHNLDDILRSLNREYFDGRISPAITWGSRSPACAVRKRTLGSYHRQMNIIRINPVLDRKSVPRYFVEFVVYHEMLHADLGAHEKNGRRVVHSREFRQRERLFNHFEKAAAWEKRGRF